MIPANNVIDIARQRAPQAPSRRVLDGLLDSINQLDRVDTALTDLIGDAEHGHAIRTDPIAEHALTEFNAGVRSVWAAYALLKMVLNTEE